MTRRITIGMAVYDDFDGVWFTVMALRMYHPEVMAEAEILVVDNNPHSPSGAAVREFIQQWTGNGRYIAQESPVGTAPPRNRVFAEAQGEIVLCIDSHILIEAQAIQRLLEFYDERPDCDDLLQGPLIYDDLHNFASHMDDQWRAFMWGVWGVDERARIEQEVSERFDAESDSHVIEIVRREGPAFEIPAHGLGLFACRKSAWLGFHPAFRGFGGEEFYIHEKYRRHGRRTLCLPFLRWTHRFQRPRGVPYQLALVDRLRNYLVGLSELGLPLEPALEHFGTAVAPQQVQEILTNLAAEGLLPADASERPALEPS